MCVACSTGIPACAVNGPCISLAQQILQYALILGVATTGIARIFFKGIYDRVKASVVRFAHARYEIRSGA